MAKNPMQPILLAGDGVVRFKENRIVSWMLDMLQSRGITLNDIAVTFDRTGKDQDDYQQLMQLIGYSVSGYGDLSSHDPDVLVVADQEAAKLVKRKKR